MKKQKISDAVIHRLPRYYRYLDDLFNKGVVRISSNSLGSKMDITASQIRQDLSCFGEFGQQGYGYKEGSGTHSKFADQMVKKTVINRALKEIINTHGDGFIQEADERTEDIDQAEAIVSDVNYEIANEANTEELVVEEPKELPLRESTATVEVVKAAQVKKSPSKTESAENELPGFMTMEDM